MKEDDDLTHLLARAADPPVATTDSFREVMVRYRKGRTRVLLAAVVAVALLGPAVGVAVGRATADNSTQVATGASPETTGTGSPVHARVDSSGDSVASLEGYGFGWATPAKRLFVRTTSDGVTIRAYLQENPPGVEEAECVTSDQGSIPCPSPPPDCPGPPDAQLQAGLSNDRAVDPGYVPAISAEATEPVTVLHASYFGVTEGDPAVWAAVRTGAGVEGVRVRFADGAIDEMAPVDGYAVVAHRTADAPSLPEPASSPEEWEARMKAAMPQGSVEALDANGATISTADLASASPVVPVPMECAIPGEVKPALPEGGPPVVSAVPATRP
ncbi:MAG: hypothetical protein ACR2HV_02760 [Acidimicrobiales bacterium]